MQLDYINHLQDQRWIFVLSLRLACEWLLAKAGQGKWRDEPLPIESVEIADTQANLSCHLLQPRERETKGDWALAILGLEYSFSSLLLFPSRFCGTQESQEHGLSG